MESNALARIVASLLLALVVAGCSSAEFRYSERLIEQFPDPDVNYQAHRANVREYLLDTQMPQRTATDAELNLPFELQASEEAPYRGKFLLLHGLNDSPYLWRDVAEELASRGYDVRAILLPGHGNTPQAQLSVSYKDWISAAREHLDLYSEPDKKLYLGGFSLGGVLATLLASECDDVDGLLLFSPAFRSQSHKLLRWAGLYSIMKPWVFGGMIIEDNPVKYNSIPINSGSQYFKTTRTLNRRWPKNPLNIPVLVVTSINDSVVDIGATEKKYARGFSSTKHMIVYDNERSGQTINGIEYRHGGDATRRILNQSHQSVLISPDNALYGTNGRVLVCNGNEYPIFMACMRYQGTHWYGAQHTASPDDIPVARSTYNPDFGYVMERFDELFL